MNNHLQIVKFNKSYNYLNFDCGIDKLNKYLINYAAQDIKRHLASVFIAIINTDNSQTVVGYYTLSSNYIDINKLDKDYTKKLPYYPYLPAVLIGRLAVDKARQGNKIGEHLLMDALRRVLTSEIAAFAVIVDAKNDKAINFYKNYGFIQFVDNPSKLFLPFSTIIKLFN